MKIILSPTKTMMNSQFKIDDSLYSTPFFQKEAINIHQLLKGFSKQKIKSLMKLSENLNIQTINDIQLWDSEKSYKTHAVYAYQGTSFKYLEPQKWKLSEADYAQNHLLILSGLYGVLCPFDLINKYRLEMGLKFQLESSKNLTQFWKDKMTTYFNSFKENNFIICFFISKKIFYILMFYFFRSIFLLIKILNVFFFIYFLTNCS
jgi:cytoplasmic iron level regulating protein YaaA (DUF328/UPF0246 family)